MGFQNLCVDENRCVGEFFSIGITGRDCDPSFLQKKGAGVPRNRREIRLLDLEELLGRSFSFSPIRKHPFLRIHPVRRSVEMSVQKTFLL